MTISADIGENRPADRDRSRLKERLRIIAVSVLINGLIVLLLFLIAFPPKPVNPPVVIVAVPERVKPPDDLKNQTVQKRNRFIDDDSAAAGMVLPVTALKSPISIEVPEFDAGFEGMPGLLSGFGDEDGNGALGRGSDGFMADVGGMTVRALKLGVILDVSGSMTDEVPAVRRELIKSFFNATIMEVAGCSMCWKGDVEFDPTTFRKQYDYQFSAPSTFRAFELLIAYQNVDAIYWFADLQDNQDETGMIRLIHLLRLNPDSESRPIRFYIHSVQHEPSEVLKEIVRRSGGEVSFPEPKR